MRAFGFLLALLCTHTLSVPPAAAEDQIQAERSRTSVDAQGVVRVYADAVDARFGSVRIQADSARTREGDTAIRFWNVSLEDGARLLRAAVLRYDRNVGEAVFSGGASLADGARTLKATTIRYRSGSGHLMAGGNPQLTYAKEGLTLSSEQLTLAAAGDSGSATGKAVVILTGPPVPESAAFDTTDRAAGEEAAGAEVASDSLVIEAESALFHDGGALVHFRGETTIRQRRIESSANRATYLRSAGRLQMAGQVRALWWGEGPSAPDTVRAVADSLEVALDDSRQIRHLAFSGSVTLEMTIAREGARRGRTIRADTCIVRFAVPGIVDEVDARGHVEVQDRVDGGDSTQVSAGLAKLRFLDGALGGLWAESAVTLRHVSLQPKAQSRLSGGRIGMRFSDGRVDEIAVKGQAVCDHQPLDDAGDEGVYLTGDYLVVKFDGGRLVSAVSSGGVRGRYRPPEEGVP